MFPPTYALITDNVVYDEPEDEFDQNVIVVNKNATNDLIDVVAVKETGGCKRHWTWLYSTPVPAENKMEEKQPFSKSVFCREGAVEDVVE